MDLADLQRHWQAFAERDPLWAILTDPARKGGRWNVDEFFATGRTEIDALVAEARRFGLPAERRRGLDFGCGVGRLTQALASHVDEVLGLDIAPAMVAQARALNRHGDRVRYQVQASPPLDGVASRSCDLVVTGRVLQHIAPEFSRRYIGELARVLAPGGFLSFDVPGRALDAPALPAGAMPAAAYHAKLDATWRPPADGGAAHVEVVVENAGPVAWPAGLALNVGNHWLAASGEVVVADDRRAAIPLPLAAGATARLRLPVSWPPPPDAAVLEIDAVHEQITWFAALGSPAVRLAVGPAPPAPAAPEPPKAQSGFEPTMEMHAVPRAEVEALLAAAGVRLLRVRPELHCGPLWESWRYDVTAGGAG